MEVFFWLIVFSLGLGLGYVLHATGITRPDTILKSLLWKDLSSLRFFLLTMAAGLVAVSYLKTYGSAVGISVGTATAGGAIIGGLLFGIGLAICGYTPGTALCGTALRKKDAIFTVFGGLVGAVVFGTLHPFLKPVAGWWSFGVATWDGLFLLLPGVTIALIAAAVLGVWAFRVADEKGHTETLNIPGATKPSKTDKGKK